MLKMSESKRRLAASCGKSPTQSLVFHLAIASFAKTVAAAALQIPAGC